MLASYSIAIFKLLLKITQYLGGAQDQVGRARAPVCPTLATPLNVVIKIIKLYTNCGIIAVVMSIILSIIGNILEHCPKA